MVWSEGNICNKLLGSILDVFLQISVYCPCFYLFEYVQTNKSNVPDSMIHICLFC